MSNMVERITKALIELKYDVKFTKTNNTEKTPKDSVELSKEGKEKMKRQEHIDAISQKIKTGQYDITEEMIDSIAHKIAQSLL